MLQRLSSAVRLIQRTTSDAPQSDMYCGDYTRFQSVKEAISYFGLLACPVICTSEIVSVARKVS